MSCGESGSESDGRLRVDHPNDATITDDDAGWLDPGGRGFFHPLPPFGKGRSHARANEEGTGRRHTPNHPVSAENPEQN